MNKLIIIALALSLAACGHSKKKTSDHKSNIDLTAPLRTLSREPGYEEEMREIFELLLANCARSFERLPCVEDVDLLRNILYSGVWLKYHCKNAKKKDKTA